MDAKEIVRAMNEAFLEAECNLDGISQCVIQGDGEDLLLTFNDGRWDVLAETDASYITESFVNGCGEEAVLDSIEARNLRIKK